MSDTTPRESIDKEEKEQRSRKLFLSETLMLAVASAGIYLFAFLYERGFLSYFGIPTQFVTVSLVTLLIFGAAAVTFLYVSAGLANMVYAFLPKHRYLAFYIPRYLLMGFLTLLVPLFLFQGGWDYAIMFGIWLVLVIGLLTLPLIRYRKEGDWEKRYDAAIKAMPSEPDSSLYTLLEKRYGLRDFGYWIFVFITLVGLAGTMGQAEATTQTNFLVLNTIPEMVVLRVSGENLICAPFDRNSKEVKKSFSIQKIAEDPKLVMNLESVGPLTPVEKLKSETVTPTPTPTPNHESTPSATPTNEPKTTIGEGQDENSKAHP